MTFPGERTKAEKFTKNMASLPEDVIAEILCYLQGHTLTSLFPFLCKQWNELFRRPKLAALVFASTWDPDRKEFDYESAQKETSSLESNVFIQKDTQLRKSCAQLLSIRPWAPGKEIWHQGTQSKKSLCWFADRNDQQLFVLTGGCLIAVSSATGAMDQSFSSIELPKQYFQADFRMALDNRCATWEHESSSMIIETRSNRVLRTGVPSSVKQRSVNMNTMLQYECRPNRKYVRRGRYDSGYINDGNTLITAHGVLPFGAPVSPAGWSVVLDGPNKHLVGSNDRWIMIIDVAKPKNAEMVFLDARTGTKVSSCKVGSISMVDEIPFARCYFISAHQCLVLFQRFLALLDFPDDGAPMLRCRVENDDNIFASFTVRYNMLFVETHPEKWFLCREESSLLVYLVRDGELHLLRCVAPFPSVNAIAVDDELNVYGTKFDSMSMFKMSIM